MEQFWITLSQTGMLSVLIGILVSMVGAMAVYLFNRVRRAKANATSDASTYPDRVKEISAELARASSEVEHVLEEFAIVSRLRNEAFANLEQRVRELAQHEKDLQTRVETLRQISLPAAEHFMQINTPAQPNPNRNYFFFGLGAALSAVITLVVKLLFNL